MLRNPKDRFLEIDVFRGCLIVGMLIYHTLFDLTLFGNLKMDLFSPFWRGCVAAGASLFVGLAGLSLTLSFSRERERKNTVSFRKYLRRGLLLTLYGVAVTLVTYFAFPDSFVRFGVLHCIGVSTLLAYPLLTRPWLSLGCGLLCIIVGSFLARKAFPFSFFLWLGFKPYGFLSFDYFPLLPWFGVILLGIFAGNILYPSGKRVFSPPRLPSFPFQGLAFLGRHSLTIYLLHQPAILGLLSLLGFIRLSL